MTAQITDSFIFRGEKYSLIGLRGGELATPAQYGMEAEMLHTACYRGYYATYELKDDGLYLRQLTLRERSGNYPPIGGVAPRKEAYQATYDGLNELVPFTGQIRLARELIEELYVHMGYQKATAFKTVLDITLEDGYVVAIEDRSTEMAEKRGAFKKRFGSGDLVKSIEEAFRLDMDLE